LTEAVGVLHTGSTDGVTLAAQTTIRLPLLSALMLVKGEHELPVTPLKVTEAAKADPALTIIKTMPKTATLVLIRLNFIIVSLKRVDLPDSKYRSSTQE